MNNGSRSTKSSSKHKSRAHHRMVSDDDNSDEDNDDDDDDDEDNNDNRSLHSVHRKASTEHLTGKLNFPSKLNATHLIEHQIDRKNSRMSIEKQKFFRYSAFNKRTMKNEIDTNTQIFCKYGDQYSNNEPAAATRAAAYKQSVQLSCTSSSSDGDDEEEGESDGSSSGSCSSSSSSYNDDDSDSSNTSSNSGSSDDDSNADEPVENKSAKSKAPQPAKASTRSATNAAAAAAAAAAAVVSMTDTNTWGFAAEAKKNLDIFRRSATSLGERVFGNFDGIDKDALIKTTAQSAQQRYAASAAAKTRLASQVSGASTPFGRAESLRSSSTTAATVADHRSAGRRKTKSHPQKQQTNERDHRQRSQSASKKTENTTILKGRANNKNLNVFAFDDTDNNTSKANIKLFTHPKTSTTTKTTTNATASMANATATILRTTTTTTATSTATKHDSKRGNAANTSTTTTNAPATTTTTTTTPGLSRTPATSSNRLNSSNTTSRKNQILSEARAKDTRNTTTATINNNLNSIRNNNNNNTSNNNMSTANKAGPRRVTLVSLPLEPKSMRNYDSSSDDEIPYLRTASTSHVKDSLDFATLRERSDFNSIGVSSKYPMLSSLSPHTPPYNKTQSMGKNKKNILSLPHSLDNKHTFSNQTTIYTTATLIETNCKKHIHTLKYSIKYTQLLLNKKLEKFPVKLRYKL